MKLLMQLCFSLLFLVAAFRNIDVAEVGEQFGRLTAFSVFAAFIFITLSTVVAAMRWRMLALSTGGNAPPMFFVASFYRGAFVNQGLPTTLGGDVLRVVELGNKLGSKRYAFSCVLFDRVMGLSGLLIINILILPLTWILLPAPVAIAVAGISACGLMAVAIGLMLPWRRIAQQHSILHTITELVTFGRTAIARPSRFLLQCLLSVIAHVCIILATVILGKQLGIDAAFWKYLVILPLVNIAALLPLSLAGWGMREGAMVALFGLVGVAAPPVLAASLSFGVISMLSTLPGMLFFLRKTGSSPISD
jgi:uncharacterized membrane protein YbhN (UPF0104 family)